MAAPTRCLNPGHEDRGGQLVEGLWGTAVGLTGTVCGFYLSQALVHGPYFTWLADPENAEGSVSSYAAFRRGHSAAPYYSVLLAQGAAAAAFAVASKREPWGRAAMVAAACPAAVGATHAVTGFGRAEVDVLSGQGTAEQIRSFRTRNVRLHAAYAAVMAAGLVALLKCRPAANRV